MQDFEIEPEVQVELDETKIRESNTEDILIDLADWLDSVEPGEVAGMKRAIAIIKANY